MLGGGCRFVTGGTDAGIMKLVGEAKAKYNPHAPLIGIAPFGAVADRRHEQWQRASENQNYSLEELRVKDCEEAKTAGGKCVHVTEICYNEVMGKGADSAALNQHHSHFVLVDNGKSGRDAFGCERRLRASLEQCVASSLDPGYPVYVLQGFPSGHAYANYEKQRVLDVVVVGAASALQAIKLWDQGCGVKNGKHIEILTNNLPAPARAAGTEGMWVDPAADTDIHQWCSIEPEGKVPVCSALQAIWLHAGNGTPKERAEGWLAGDKPKSSASDGDSVATVARNLNERIEDERNSCWNWEDVGPKEPGKGEEIQNEEIAEVLRFKCLFTKSDLMGPRYSPAAAATVTKLASSCYTAVTFMRTADRCCYIQVDRWNQLKKSWDRRYMKPKMTRQELVSLVQEHESALQERDKKMSALTRQASMRREGSESKQYYEQRGGRGGVFDESTQTKAHKVKLQAFSRLGAPDPTAADILDVHHLTVPMFQKAWEQALATEKEALKDIEHWFSQYFAGTDPSRADFEKKQKEVSERFKNKLPQRDMSKLFAQRAGQWRQEERDVMVMVMSAATQGTKNNCPVFIKCKVKNLRRISADEVQNQLHLAAINDLELDPAPFQAPQFSNAEEPPNCWGSQVEPVVLDKPLASSLESPPVPLVSICVSGGQGSIETALNTVQTGTASLLVRGSGKAADLLSDTVLLRYTHRHPAHIKHRSPLQGALWDFFVLCGFRPDAGNDTQVLKWDEVIAAIQQELSVLKFLKLSGAQRYSGMQVSQILTHSEALRDAAVALVTLVEPRGYQVQTVFGDDKCKPSECLTILLQAVQSGEFALCAMCAI